MPETTQHTAEASAACSGNTIIQAATAPLYITTAADAVAVPGSALRVKMVRQLHQAVPGTVVKAATWIPPDALAYNQDYYGYGGHGGGGGGAGGASGYWGTGSSGVGGAGGYGGCGGKGGDGCIIIYY